MQVARTVFEYDFDLSGAGTTNQEFNLDDLSHAGQLLFILKVTAAATDATDTVDVRIQDRGPDGIWTTRARFKAITGDLSPSTTAPEVLRLALEQSGPLSSAEEAYEPSGSAGGSSPTVIGDGVVINGPFPPLYRTSAGRGASWRAQFVVAETNAAAFTGTLYAIAKTEL